MKVRAWFACLVVCVLSVLPVNPAWALLDGLPDTAGCIPVFKDPTGEKYKKNTRNADINLEVLQTQIELDDVQLNIPYDAKARAYRYYLDCIEYLSYQAEAETAARLEADLVKLAAFFERHEAVPQVRVLMLSEVLFKQSGMTKDAALLDKLGKRLKALVAEGQAIKYKPIEKYNEAVTDAYMKWQADKLNAEADALVSGLLANAAGTAALAGDKEDAKAMLRQALKLKGDNTEAASILARLEEPEQATPVVDVQLNEDFLGSKVSIVKDVEFSPDGAKLLILSIDGTYREWDWMAGKIVRFGTVPKPMSTFKEIGYLPDLHAFYVIGIGKTDDQFGRSLEIWDEESLNPLMISSSDRGFQVPAGAGFVVRRNTDKLAFIDPADGTEIRSVELSFTGKYRYIDEVVSKKGLRQSADLTRFQVSADGSKFIVKGFPADHVVAFGDTQTGKVKTILVDDFSYDFYGMDISADGRTAAVTNYATLSVDLIDTKSATRIAKLTGHSEDIGDTYFSDDGTRLVTRGDDLRAIAWDVATGKKIFELPKFKDEIYGGDFSPDGKFFATGGADGATRIWEMATGKLLVAYYAIEKSKVAPANGLALLANGRFAANDVDGEMLTIAGKPASLEQLKSLSYGQTLPSGLFAP